MQNSMEMSAALRAPQQSVPPVQTMQPVQGVADPFTQGGFGTGGFGMGQYAAPMPVDREFTGGAMKDMGQTALGGGGTGNGQLVRDQQAAAAASAKASREQQIAQYRENARIAQESADGGR